MAYWIRKIFSISVITAVLLIAPINLIPNSAAQTTAIIEDTAPEYMDSSSPPIDVLNLTLFSNFTAYLNRITVTVNNVISFDPTIHLSTLSFDPTSGVALYQETNSIPGFQLSDNFTSSTVLGWFGSNPVWNMTLDNLISVTPQLPISDPGQPNYYIVIRTNTTCVDASKFQVSIQAQDINTTYDNAPLTGVSSKVITIDTLPPNTNVNIGSPQFIGMYTYVNSTTNFSLIATDTASGVQSTMFRTWIDGLWSTWVPYLVPFQISGNDGIAYIEYYSKDPLNHTEVLGNTTVYLENSLPITTLDIDPTTPIYIDVFTYVNGNTKFNLSAIDLDSGLNSTWFRIWNDGMWLGWSLYTGPFQITGNDGMTFIEYNSIDNLGQYEATNNVTVYLENSLPITTLNINPITPKYIGVYTYVNGNTELNLSANDSGSGLNSTWFRIWNDGVWSGWSPYSGPFQIAGNDGLTFIEYNSSDNLGQYELTNNITVYLENSLPITTLEIDPATPKYIGIYTYVNNNTEFNLSGFDSGSGLDSTWFRIWNDGMWSGWSPYIGPFQISGNDGLSFIEYNSSDNLGHYETTNNVTVYLENNLPTTTLDINPTTPKFIGVYTYVNNNTEFNLNASDSDSGLRSIWFRIWNDGIWSSWFPYIGPFQVTGNDGVIYIEYNSTDNLGQNEAANNITVYLDDTPPSTDLAITGPRLGSSPTKISATTELELTSAESGSGINRIEYSIDGGAFIQYTGSFELTDYGHHNISFRAIDNLGNVETSQTHWSYVNIPPTLPSIPGLLTKVGDEFSYYVIASDIDSKASLEFSIVDPIEGMEIDPDTGEFTWTPTSNQVGEHTIQISVSDGLDSDTQELTIVVKALESAPIMSPGIIILIIILAIASIMGSTASFTEFGKYKLFLLFIPLYTRLKKKDVLDHFTRGRIYGYIQANPGDHLNSIKRALELNNGSLVYHLNTLEKNGYIYSKIDRSYKRFYPTRTKLPERNISELTRIQRDIVEVINANPGISQKEIATKLDISKQLVNYHVKILQDAGCINIIQGKKHIGCYVPEDFIRK